MLRHRLSGLFVAAMFATAFGTANAAAPPVVPFTAHYRLLRNGSPIGKATITLAPGPGGAWTFTTRSKGTAGLAALLGASVRETSTFHWVGDRPQCDAYEYLLDSGLKKQHRSVTCDWNDRTIEVDDKGSHAFAAQPGTIERHTIPLALVAGLAAGKARFRLPVAVRDRIEIQNYEAKGRQDVHVPAGTFSAIEVVRVGGGDDFEAWFAPAALPAPIKVDQRGKDGFSLELESWSKD